MLKDKDTVEMEVFIIKQDLPEDVMKVFSSLISSHRTHQNLLKNKDLELKRLTDELVECKLVIQNIRSLL